MTQSTLKTPANDSDHRIGSLNSEIIIVEYGDYECPHCGMAAPIFNRILKEYGDDVCFVFRHFPLVNLHSNAGIAAVAAEAAGVQGKFWEFHHALFANQYDLSSESILSIARDTGLDLRKFTNDWERDDLLNRVHHNIDTGNQNGISGTPAIFINGILFTGILSYDEIRDEIELILRDDQVYL